MRHKPTRKYCADRQAIAAMKRDGIGWGHDLECGCFEAPVTPRRGFVGNSLMNWMKGL